MKNLFEVGDFLELFEVVVILSVCMMVLLLFVGLLGISWGGECLVVGFLVRFLVLCVLWFLNILF